MKKIALLFSVLVLCLFGNAVAQQTDNFNLSQDSLIINLENKVTMVVYSPDSKRWKSYANIDSLLFTFNQVLGLYKDSLINSGKPLAFVLMKEKNSQKGLDMKVSENIKNANSYSFEDEKGLIYSTNFKYQVLLSQANNLIAMFYCNSLADLKELNQKTLIPIIDQALTNRGRHSNITSTYYKYQQNQLDLSSKITRKSGQDQLVLSILNTEAIYVRNTFVPGWTLALGVSLKVRGTGTFLSYLSMTSYGFINPTEDYKTDINQFLDFQIGFHDKSIQRSTRLLFGGGYLIKQTGNHLQDNSYRLFVKFQYQNIYVTSGKIFKDKLSGGNGLPYFGIGIGF